jgi:hypothetical protein
MIDIISSIDDLAAIAAAYGITIDDLLDANPFLKDHPDRIACGTRITIPGVGVPAQLKGWLLGDLSRKYETGRRGTGTVSSGVGDPGGISYGSYQMTSQPDGGTVRRFVMQENFRWRQEFVGLIPGTSRFSAQWKRIARREPLAFAAAQHDYIKRAYFDVLARRIETDHGIDVTTRSQALQDVVWSTAVQMGPYTAVIRRAFANMRADGTFDPNAADFDRNAIIAIYRERGRRSADGTLVYFSSSSAAAQAGIANRFKNEQRDALRMLASGA